MPRATIKTVAKESGFSITTVSRVLSGADYPINHETRKKIIQVAEKLDYVPNILARSLKTNLNKEVAIVVPSVTNPFYTDLLLGTEYALAAKGFNMLFYLLMGDQQRDASLIRSIKSKMIEGVIVAADCITPPIAAELKTFQDVGASVIVVDYATDLLDTPRGVFFDHYQGGLISARYLVQKGHRRIAFATRTLDKPSRCVRKRGFTDAMREAGLDFSDEDVFISHDDEEFQAGMRLARQILSCAKEYTAVAVANDATALGVLTALRSANVRVPEDVSVLGFDDSAFSRMSSPLLTTVRVPARDIGRMAAEMVLDGSKNQSMYSIYLTPELVERESVLDLRKKRQERKNGE